MIRFVDAFEKDDEFLGDMDPMKRVNTVTDHGPRKLTKRNTCFGGQIKRSH